MNHLIIKVSPVLSKLGKELQISEEKEFSPILTSFREINLSSPVKFGLKIRNVGSALLVGGSIFGRLLLKCSRCLEKFIYPLKVGIKEVFRFGGDEQSFKIVEESIDLGPLAEQAFLLNLPFKTLCKKDCFGLCPSCGQNLNEGKCSCKRERFDPRLSKLKNLLKK